MASKTKSVTVDDEQGGGVALADPPEDAVEVEVLADPAPLAAAGRCGETPCFSRTELTWTGTPSAGRVVTIAVTGKGRDNVIDWNMGDGTTLRRRGGFTYTYATTGAKTITPKVVASSVLYGSSKSVTVIA